MNNKSTRAERSLASKKDRLKTETCRQCGQYIIRDGTQGRKRYCNSACKQAHFRRRHQWDEKQAQSPAPNRTAQQMVNIAYAHLVDIETAL